VARRPGLSVALLIAGVLLAHVAAMDWVAVRLQGPLSVLKTVAPPLFTRTLQPTQPPPVPVAAAPVAPEPPRPTARMVPPKRAASAPSPAAEAVAETRPAEASAENAPAEASPAGGPGSLSREAGEGRGEGVAAPPPPPTAVAAAPPLPVPAEPAASIPDTPASAASAPAAVAAAPASAPASAPPASTDTWPADTRLSYRLGGRFRSGNLYGDARVQWQRAGADYQVRIDIDITLFATLVMTSQGQVSPTGLQPRAYEELRPGKRRAAQFGEAVLQFENGQTAPRPAGVQDTASQFVELSHRFATGQETLEVGRSITVWLARPSAVDRWTYDVVEREVLDTPTLGPVEAFRLKPRPIANPRGNITAEMWFAPSLQYLPVRIKVIMGEEAHVDLLVDRIEQR
jgi:hypothetical protein